jgi:hypothetical protein
LVSNPTVGTKSPLKTWAFGSTPHVSVADDVWDELKRHAEPEVLELAWTVATYIMFGKLELGRDSRSTWA